MADYPRPKTITAAAFTRPADTTAYASGDLVANSVTAGSVVPIIFANAARQTGYRGYVRRVGLYKTQNLLTTADFRLHLFRDVAPTVTNGDNGALAVATQSDKWIGAVELPFTTTPPVILTASGNRIWQVVSVAIPFLTTSSANLWGLLEARSAYAPASAEQFTAMLDVDQF